MFTAWNKVQQKVVPITAEIFAVFFFINILLWKQVVRIEHDYYVKLTAHEEVWSTDTLSLRVTRCRLIFHTSKSRCHLWMLLSSLVHYSYLQEVFLLKKKWLDINKCYQIRTNIPSYTNDNKYNIMLDHLFLKLITRIWIQKQQRWFTFFKNKNWKSRILKVDVQWLPFENWQSPSYVVNCHFSRHAWL